MDTREVLNILREYGIDGFSEKNEIDSTNGDDYRLNKYEHDEAHNGGNICFIMFPRLKGLFS